jgi:hypothetical protein
MSYRIKKNNHYSGFHFRPILGNMKLSFECILDETCTYNLGDVDQYDINKLIGLSYGYHHINSIRLGWNYNNILHQILPDMHLYWMMSLLHLP